MGPEDNPADEISEEEYFRGLVEAENAAPKSCSRCNAGMPSFRVNPLCEECFAEESDEHDSEAEMD